MKPVLYIIDDEQSVLCALAKGLRSRLYNIVTFDDPKKALESLQKAEDIFLIISDHKMPILLGIDLLAEAKHINPRIARYMMGNFEDFNIAIEALNNGTINKFFAKPWKLNELKNNIDLALENHYMQRLTSDLDTQILTAGRSLKKYSPGLDPTQKPHINPNQINFIDHTELVMHNLNPTESLALVVFVIENVRDIYLNIGIQKYKKIRGFLSKRIDNEIGEHYYYCSIDDSTFCMLIPYKAGDSESIKLIASELLFKCKMPYSIANTVCNLTISAGVAYYPDHGQSAEFLLRNAQSAAFNCISDKNEIKQFAS